MLLGIESAADMHSYYYGVQTALAYILNHFFYNAVHYTYIAGEYYPYKRKNPRSSNPHRIYEDLYEPWKDKDEFNKVVIQTRLNIKNGILAQTKKNIIDSFLANKLGRICDELDSNLFYPFVFRINIKSIKKNRLQKSGSGLSGSYEYLVSDLLEREINDILFLDYEGDALIKNLVKYEYENFRKKGNVGYSKREVLELLEDRVNTYASTLKVSSIKARSSSSTP